MTFFCIADKDSSLGFKLTGVQTREVSCRMEALAALQAALSLSDVGIIIITDKAASYIKEEVSAHIYSPKLPLILEIPSRSGSFKRRSSTEFLRESIGVSV